MTKKLTTKEFIKRARAVHGNKYDYSQVEYVNARTKVKIICPIHGKFEQTPYHHIKRKQGCSSCAGNKISTTDQFILKAKIKHSDFYDYSKVKYKNNKTKVIIICPIHGEFEQRPDHHLAGIGCDVCGNEAIRQSLQSTTEEFIEKAIAKHGNKYDYSKVDYMNNHTKVKIICPKHGVFRQRPHDHLDGQGCFYCYGNERKTTEQFIEQAKLKHGNKYDYSKVDYKNNKTPVEIICPIHGEFQQAPGLHLRGEDCPDCRMQKCFETKRKNGTFNTSQPEEKLYKLLVDKFGKKDVFRQYKDKTRYPYVCDFYVKSHDLFIELNAFWTHGKHWFDKKDIEDLKVLDKWISKSENQPFYKNAIYVWTQHDPLKKRTAEENNLNYKVFWDNDLSDAKEWLNSTE